jgi:cyclophilin family peptidyl-prolyl cis-trans isomerase/HEAT repeat protein
VTRSSLAPRLAALALLSLAACGRRDGEGGESAAAPVTVAPSPSAVTAIRTAESARRTEGIPKAALSDRNVSIRRNAARALSRIADPPAIERLEKSLGDEDPEVVAWSAHGLGATCSGREPALVRALVARAASLEAAPSPKTDPDARLGIDATSAIADALSRCGSALAEQTLAAWLAGPKLRAETAALALGRLAGRRHRLEDATLVALLEAAAQKPPLAGALYPLSRLDVVSEPIGKRLLTVATEQIAGTERIFAIRSLGAAGPGAADALRAVFVDERSTIEARAAAATTLGRLGSEAAPALASGLAEVVKADRAVDEAWLRASTGPLLAALRALPPKAGADDALVRLAELPLPDGVSAALKRRIVELRCTAASVLAHTASLSARLVQCAPEGYARIAALATLRVLDRGTLTLARYEMWKKYAASEDAAVRRAALGLVPAHPEIPPIAPLLAKALGSAEPGIVVQAARILAKDPRRGGTRPLSAAPEATETPSEEIVEALGHAFDAPRAPDAIEARVALATAAGALGVLRLKPRVEKLCSSDNVAVRRAAESALRALGDSGAACPQPPQLEAKEPASPAFARVASTIIFVTDSGRYGMRLDPALAPLAVERVVSLARAGFFDHMAIHRAVPGSVVQFGDPVGDGFGGSGKPPLPTESAPVEFQRFFVGMALSGRDSGSSQIFVTLTPEPSLYGDYPVLGWADSDWAQVAEGDVIERVEVAP